MWKSAQYVDSTCLKNNQEDDWDTDPDFVNDVSEEDQRWGSKTIEGSGRTAAAINLEQLRNEVSQEDVQLKERFAHQSQKDNKMGFGGKFGLQKDRVDKSAVGYDYHEKLAAHTSQKDYTAGFGGKFGVQKDRVDKSAVGWEYHEKVDKHESQKDYSLGFGGKFGVQKDRVDKSAVGWEHHEKVDKHESQKDYCIGFGGKFGVQKDRIDKSAVGWDHHETVEKHSSQLDASKGFGGKFGIENDRKDSCAHRWEEREEPKTKEKVEIVKGDTKSLASKFENLAKQDEIILKEKIEKERQKRLNQEKIEKELNKNRVIFQNEDSNLENEHEDLKVEINSSNNYISENQHQHKSKHLNKIGISVLPVPKTEISGQNVIESINENINIDIITEQNVLNNDNKMEENKSEATNLDVFEDLGQTAIALYDYEAAESDEISFDPDELITHIEMIDEGWWRGQCRGKVGLFPSNYVKLN